VDEMAGWDTLPELVRLEIIQRSEEGYEVKGFKEKFAEAEMDENKLKSIYEELMKLSINEDFSFSEPSELEEIRQLRPTQSFKLEGINDEKKLQDQILGAWLGRSAGCALGKPLEHWDYLIGNDHHPGWKNVELWFKGADAWPIKGYTPRHSRAEQEWGLGLNDWSPGSTSDTIQFMESDDDIRYTVLGLILLEEKGIDFDSYDVGKLWHKYLSYQQVCTAETQSYLNFAQITSHMKGEKPSDWETKKDWVRMHLNPYREWIGAQIRVDAYGYAAAGNPELAAELAWRDASFSHVKNGIYGAMFVSAMIAAAFVEKDNEKIVQIGLEQIPENSRLATAIRQAVEIAKSASCQEELVSTLWESFKHYDPVHTINNAALVAASLIYAGDDFERAIVTSVYGGWDTDCNGATVGSIMGAKLGASQLPENWIGPLNNTLYADVIGFHPISISDCAERTYNVYKKLQAKRIMTRK
jgi:ADP-ribosylglycohydrolase